MNSDFIVQIKALNIGYWIHIEWGIFIKDSMISEFRDMSHYQVFVSYRLTLENYISNDISFIVADI